MEGDDVVGRGGILAKVYVKHLYRKASTTRPAGELEEGTAPVPLILKALDLNRTGHLFSIDVPAKAGEMSMDWGLPEGLEPGFLVPTSLRSRWTPMSGRY